MGTTTAAVFVAIGLVVAGCSGGDSAAGPAVEPTPTTAIGDPATPEPEAEPTATAVPTATPEPTVTAEPELSEDEAAVIEAWERFLALGMDALGKDPSPEALDYEAYMADGALDGWLTGIAEDRGEGVYITGRMDSSRPEVSIQGSGAATIEMCFLTDWTGRSLSDDSVAFEEGVHATESRARFENVLDVWILVATEFGGEECEF